MVEKKDSWCPLIIFLEYATVSVHAGIKGVSILILLRARDCNDENHWKKYLSLNNDMSVQTPLPSFLSYP